MLMFDKNSEKRLINPRTKIEDKLFIISRYIEEKNSFKTQVNYWEDKFKNMNANERIFYKLWLWLNYVESESLVMPITEFHLIYGEKRKMELESYLVPSSSKEYEMEEFYKLNGGAGKILFNWAMKELIASFNLE